MDKFIDVIVGSKSAVVSNGFITAMVVVAAVMWFSYKLSKTLFKGRIHGSAIAIVLALIAAYVCGAYTGKSKGVADIAFLSGFGLMGGAMFRDFAIISTAYGADIRELKKAGLAGVLSIFISIILTFYVGAAIAYFFGYTSAKDMATIGAGAVTFIVGPVTGAAVGASSAVVALSIAAGVIKSILVMVLTPLLAKYIGLTSPAAALVYGGLMGTTSGTAAGLAATDVRLVPYGAMTATFYTGIGCLLCPSVLYLSIVPFFS